MDTQLCMVHINHVFIHMKGWNIQTSKLSVFLQIPFNISWPGSCPVHPHSLRLCAVFGWSRWSGDALERISRWEAEPDESQWSRIKALAPEQTSCSLCSLEVGQISEESAPSVLVLVFPWDSSLQISVFESRRISETCFHQPKICYVSCKCGYIYRLHIFTDWNFVRVNLSAGSFKETKVCQIYILYSSRDKTCLLKGQFC